MARPNDAEWGLAADVLRVRLSQMIINERLKRREFKIPVHLALGHEAVAVAVSAAMAPNDALCLTHRNIHYNLARSTAFAAEVAELRLQPSGISGGQMGCMNMTNPAAGAVYTSSILGNCLSVGAGAALAGTVTGDASCTFICTGDGALEEGSFWESIEFLKSFNVPAIVVVENNGWAMWTRIDERRCPIDLTGVAKAFAVPYQRLSGNDVVDYAARLRELRAGALAQPGPAIVEVDLATLGDYRLPADGKPEGRHVNYHHGAAPNVELSDWPALRDGDADPVRALETRFDPARLREIARKLRHELEAQCP